MVLVVSVFKVKNLIGFMFGVKEVKTDYPKIGKVINQYMKEN